MSGPRLKTVSIAGILLCAVMIGGCDVLKKIWNKEDSEDAEKIKHKLKCLRCEALECQACQADAQCLDQICGCELCRNANNNTEPPMNQTPLAQIITTKHRFHQGQMFGGWGPHLGKLLRDPRGTLWFADDTGNNLEHNPAVAYYRYTDGQWILIGANPTVGKIRQNMGSLMDNNGLIYSYGIDVKDKNNNKLQQCYFDTKQNYKDCINLGIPVDRYVGYIGAAMTPSGQQMIWWTHVENAQGGQATTSTFNYVYNDGTSWKGPIISNAAGYNNVAYVNIAFSGDSNFVMLGQGLKGDVANQQTWRFAAMLGESTLGQPIEWKLPFGEPQGGDLGTTSADIWVDDLEGEHIFIKSISSSTSTYYYKPKDGAVSQALFSIPMSYRVRFIKNDDNKLYLVYGIHDKGLHYRIFDLANHTGSIPWETSAEVHVDLPPGYERIQGIWPESIIYQATSTKGINFAINGDTREGEILHVRLP